MSALPHWPRRFLWWTRRLHETQAWAPAPGSPSARGVAASSAAAGAGAAAVAAAAAASSAGAALSSTTGEDPAASSAVALAMTALRPALERLMPRRFSMDGRRVAKKDSRSLNVSSAVAGTSLVAPLASTLSTPASRAGTAMAAIWSTAVATASSASSALSSAMTVERATASLVQSSSFWELRSLERASWEARLALLTQPTKTMQRMAMTTATMRAIHQPVGPKPSCSPRFLKAGASTSEMTDMSLMRMLSAGPEVSLNGSPTVSPLTTAEWRLWYRSRSSSLRLAWVKVSARCSCITAAAASSVAMGAKSMMDLTLVASKLLKTEPFLMPYLVNLLAAWSSPSRAHFSTHFLALSQAPPALDMVRASMKPEDRAPTSKPARPSVPRRKPTMTGAKMAATPGRTISATAEVVAMATQLAELG
mmetsp:Transcript_18808/g.71616  ORF Transcript_18808/g.71616 Transcript_18808/m.71616 type:complete len:422 (-) Transcript_18808:1881-3146(-)